MKNDMKKKVSINTVKEVFIMTAATAIIACAVFFFLVPSHAAVSSISGLAIVLCHFIPVNISTMTMILNVALLAVGFIFCGNEFGAKTVYNSIMLPVFIGILERLFPDFTSFTGEAALDVLCYIFVVSIGLSLLFTMNASSGGLDIVAMIMSKYMHMDVGRAVTIAGMIVACSSVFAYDAKTVLLSIIGSYFNGMMVDNFIFNRNLKRRVCIVSPYEKEIRDYVINVINSGASIYEVTGAYHMEKHNEIIVIVDKKEYQMLMSYVEKIDPQAFVTVYQVSAMQYRSKKLPERDFSVNIR